VVEFCVNCDEEPSPSEPKQRTSIASSDATTSLCLALSRTSTPPTEVSSTLSSPTFSLPEDTEEILRRRQQSDLASAEIGNRLLKGWAMLADECPGSSCFGVPLVRPPKSGGGKDPRKECVICGTIYIEEKDVSGWNRLVPIESPKRFSDATVFDPTSTGHSSRDQLQGKGVAFDETPLPPADLLNQKHASPPVPLRSHHFRQGQSMGCDSSGIAGLEASTRSLELTLNALSQRLTSLAGGQVPIDPTSISQTAEAISKVTHALIQIKQLQWSEHQAQDSQY